jgi:hypothetical protein
LRELELGTLLPICNSIDIGSTQIYFWYKKINEAIIHRIKLEVECRGAEFFRSNGFNEMDVVLGGDHGAHRFCAVIQLIFWNGQSQVKPYAVTIHVGNIDCNKDTGRC